MEHTQHPAFDGTQRYAIRRHIGGGSMGLVYEGYDRERNAVVALKTLRSPSGDMYRLKQEFRALADLSHPNLVTLYELVGSDDAWFIVMELVRGDNFLAWVREEDVDERSLGHTVSWVSNPTGANRVLEVTQADPDPEELPAPSLVKDLPRLQDALVQVVRGIAALHGAGKLHRDLKPSNVLVTREGRVVLVDFGLIYDTDRAASELSRVEKVVGTAAFMPPEQARGDAPSPASDMYCIGVMLFQALTGRLPYEGSLVQILLNKQQDDPPAPSSMVDGVPEALDRLCVDLLARDPERRPSARDTLQRLGESPDPATELPTRTAGYRRLEGREAARQELEDAWAEARSGRARLTLVAGRSGMGKTSLVRHFLHEVRRHEDVIVLRGRCYERESVPFKAFDNFVDAMRRRLERLPDDVRTAVLPDDVGALARVFPALQRFVPTAGDEPAVEVDPSGLQRRAFDAFRILIRNLTTVRPVIVFLDDVQWGDIDSARLLSALVADLREVRLLVMVAYRSEDVDSSAFLLHFLGDPTVQSLAPRKLELAELSEAVATAVARGLAGDDLPDPSEAAVWAARESGGNPFLMSELVHGLEAAAKSDRGMRDLASYTLEALFQERVAGLEEGPRRLMEAVALAGQPLSLRIVCRAAGIDEDGLDALNVLRAWRLVRTSRGPLGDMLEPYHQRIARAVVEALPPDSLPARHLRLAQAMEAIGWNDPEVLMTHYRAAGEGERAGLLAMEAARAAADGLAFGRAAELYRAALDLREWPWEEREQLEIELGDALVYAGRGEEAARTFLKTSANAGADRALSLRQKAGGQLIFIGRVQDGLVHLADVLRASGLQLAGSPFWTLVWTAWRRFRLRYRSLEFEPVPEALANPDLLRKVDASWYAALGLSLVDPLVCSFYHAQSFGLALDAREPYRVARALAMELPQGVAWGSSPREHQALLIRRGRELAARSGRAHATGLIALGEGVVAYMEGRWDAARRALRRAERIFVEQCTGVAFETSAARLYAVKSEVWRGRLAEAADLRRRLLRGADASGNQFLGDGLRTDVCVWLSVAEGRIDDARLDLGDVLARWSRPAWDERRFRAMAGTVELLLYERRYADAWEELQRAAPDIRRGRLHRIDANRRRLDDLRGRTALALAASTGDKRHLREAKRAAKRLLSSDTAASPAVGHLLMAGVHALNSDKEHAMDALRVAMLGFDQAQMSLHRAVTRLRLAGYLLGNDRVREQEIADQWFARENVHDSARLADLIAPGF